MNISEAIKWADTIYQIARGDKVEGGQGGIANIQAIQLAARTQFLKTMIEGFSDYKEFTYYKTAQDPTGTVAGIANTPAGKIFRVADGAGSVISFNYYLNQNGNAVKVSESPGQGSITNNIREYEDETRAMNDVAAGNILSGGRCYIRVSSDGIESSEYINNDGSLEATGEKRISQQSLETLESLFFAEEKSRKSLIDMANIPGYYFVIWDENFREVFGLDSASGAPTAHTLRVWLDRISESNYLPSLKEIPGYSLVHTMLDETGAERMTDLAISAEDGTISDWVMKRWADRLAPLLSDRIDITAQRPSLAGTWKHPGGDEVPYETDLRTVVGLGSSSTNRSKIAYAAMAAELGAAYVNLGDEGASIQQNAAQIGAVPALLTVSGGIIPASGPVNVTASNMPLNSNMNAFSGTLAGIQGVFAWSAGSTGTFTRSVEGSAVAVAANTAFIPDYRKYRANCIILESGKNDINTSRSAALILADTVTIASWFAPYIPSTVVMGHFANGSYTAAQRQILATLNAKIAETFGNRAIDQQAWLTSAQLWTDLAGEGITPTEQDYADQANGDVPRSLMIAARDHLTAEAYGYRMKYLVKPKLIELGLYRG
ncbi:hypothetical protein JSX94_22470 [Raoultella ornithinolytica]|uniref:hypothetical protein n=1 Tax=Raoultella ornithinolytica TaxID=54291 RepID=UPI0019522A64|nr:hypothetical protein [Raoultella ornithinolytica]MBM6479724.1 hypothetical protein [Raoultella ornithinolytica]